MQDYKVAYEKYLENQGTEYSELTDSTVRVIYNAEHVQ